MHSAIQIESDKITLLAFSVQIKNVLKHYETQLSIWMTYNATVTVY